MSKKEREKWVLISVQKSTVLCEKKNLISIDFEQSFPYMEKYEKNNVKIQLK